MRVDAYVLYNTTEDEFHTENGIVPLMPQEFLYIYQEQFEEHRSTVEEMHPNTEFHAVPVQLVKPLTRVEKDENGEETHEHNYSSSMEFKLELFDDLVEDIDYSMGIKL